jgi:hypothetical protein
MFLSTILFYGDFIRIIPLNVHTIVSDIYTFSDINVKDKPDIKIYLQEHNL